MIKSFGLNGVSVYYIQHDLKENTNVSLVLAAFSLVGASYLRGLDKFSNKKKKKRLRQMTRLCSLLLCHLV